MLPILNPGIVNFLGSLYSDVIIYNLNLEIMKFELFGKRNHENKKKEGFNQKVKKNRLKPYKGRAKHKRDMFDHLDEELKY